jgi:hypothetical protein
MLGEEPTARVPGLRLLPQELRYVPNTAFPGLGALHADWDPVARGRRAGGGDARERRTGMIGTLLYLLDPAGAFVTGRDVLVNGGRVMAWWCGSPGRRR